LILVLRYWPIKSFKIINENDQKLRLSSIKLMGGSSSYFKINADGFIDPEVSNIEIEQR
jgi:hypothetical protein